MLSQDCRVSLPRQPSPARAATQPFPPDTTDLPIEQPETAIVRRSPVIPVVAAELSIQGFHLLAHRFVPVLSAPFGDRLQPPAESFADRLYLQPGLHQFLERFVVNIVKIDVGKERTDWLPLPCPGLAHEESPSLDDPDLDPFPDQSEHAAVVYALLDHPHELLSHYRIKRPH